MREAAEANSASHDGSKHKTVDGGDRVEVLALLLPDTDRNRL
jgi:hypothetical protein